MSSRKPKRELPIKIFSGSSADNGFRLLLAAFPVSDGRPKIFTESITPDCWIIEYVMKGRGFLKMPPFEYHPGPGDLYILPKRGQPYSFQCDPSAPWSKACVLVDGPLVERLLDAYGLRDTRMFSGCRDLLRIFEKIYALNNAREDSQFEALALVAALFNALRGRDAESGPGADAGEKIGDNAEKLKRLLDEGVESEVSVGDFCKAAKANKSSLVRTFRQRYGDAPYAYLMSRRIERAKAFLKFSSMPVKEVAARLQFSDQYHFSNRFKKKTGMSPSAYRSGGKT